MSTATVTIRYDIFPVDRLMSVCLTRSSIATQRLNVSSTFFHSLF